MSSKRLIASAYLSNTLEFFEYTLFGAISLTIEKTYFHHVDWINPHILTVFAFCISLLVRPIGSLLFGYIGDKISRLLSLQISIGCMTISSLTMALLPSTDSIGEIAVFFVLLSRVLQGISAGGEYNGAAIFAIESYSQKAWKISGYLTSSALMGLVLASLTALILSINGLPDYSWRFAFGLGSLLGVVSFILRNVPDPKTPKEQPLSAYKNSYLVFLTIFFISGQTSALSYFCFFTLKKALAKLPQFASINVAYPTISLLLFASLLSIVFGNIAQRLNSSMVMRYGILSIILFTPFSLALMSIPSLLLSLFCLSILAVFLGCHGATQHAYSQNFIPKHLRQRFISIAFSCGTGILGSFVLWITADLDLKQPNLIIFVFSLISIGAFICTNIMERSDDFPNQTQQRNSANKLRSAS